MAGNGIEWQGMALPHTTFIILQLFIVPKCVHPFSFNRLATRAAFNHRYPVLLSRSSRIAAMPKRKSGESSSGSSAKSRKYTRRGVEAAVQLLSFPPSSSSSSRWDQILHHYEDMLRKKGGQKLVELDRQRTALGTLGDGNEKKLFITKSQLLDIVIPWKFAKGKPRNALKPLLQSNSEMSVEDCSKRALEVADRADNSKPENQSEQQELIKEAIDELCKLKGIGPASASAVLSIFYPNLFAFMDDEVIEALYDGKRGYTLKIYQDINERCREISTSLNAIEHGKSWTVYDIGRALWTVAAMKAFGEEDTLNILFDGENDGESTKSEAK